MQSAKETTKKDAIKKDAIKPFGTSDRIGYMLGDLGNSLLFNLIGSYLLVFYTDVFGISAAAVGTLLIVSRVWDAINDPMMGVFVDKRKPGKHGKFRPYLLYAGVPVGLFAILTFTAIPGMAESFKLPYAYITYIGFGMAYTAINIPYGSLASVMTSDPVERTSLSTFRTIGALVANLLLMVVTPMLIFDAQGGVTAKGFLIAAVIYAIVSNICYIFAFKMTTERIQHQVEDKNQPKVSLVDSVKMLFKNRALIGIMIATFGMLVATFVPQALHPYLFKDYFKSSALLGIAGIVGVVAPLLILPITGKLVAKFGKREVATSTIIVSLVSYAILFFIPIANPYVYMALYFLSNLGMGFFTILTWALVGDAIDYQAYLTGKREEGIVYASYSLVRKLVQAVVGGIGGFSLALIGYQSGAAAQTEEVANGIRMIVTGIPFAGIILGFVAMMFIYNLSKSKLAELDVELAKKGLK